jgi:hypothetical protein
VVIQKFDDGTNVSGTTTPAWCCRNFKITDGTEGAGKVLTSDATGLAKLTTPAVTSVNKITRMQIQKNTSRKTPMETLFVGYSWYSSGSDAVEVV